MAFSDGYKAVRNQHAADVATALGLASTAVHFGSPGMEITGNHAVLSCESLDSDLDHPVASGNRPGVTVDIAGEAFLTYPASNEIVEDKALGFADSLCALVEAGATYGSVGMLPVFTRFELGELTGIIEGEANLQLHIRWGIRVFIQRARG